MLKTVGNIIWVMISRRMRWAGHIARMKERRSAYKFVVGKTEGRRPLGRPRRRWEDNIKVDLQEVGWGAWTSLIWLRIRTDGGLCKRGNEPSGSIKCGQFLD
jgi:hypothetical protein